MHACNHLTYLRRLITLEFVIVQAACSLNDSQAYNGLNDNHGVVLSSRWHGIYVLVAMLFVWRCLHAAVLYMRTRLVW